MNNSELQLMQNYPLELKIAKSKLRVQEWVDAFGEDGVYISFSGGKDSTVLLHFVREICGYKDIPAVYVDTGLEYPEVKQFVKTFNNVTIIRPKMTFREVIENYGYPVISKEQSQYIYEARTTKSEKLRDRRINGDSRGRFKISKKWKYLLDSDFKISHKCCTIMKKEPVKRYEKQTNRKPILGTMACESILRRQSYLRNGCNSFDSSRPVSTPLGFWTEQDILQYIQLYKLNIPIVYGDIVVDNKTGLLKTTKCDRTGCVYCGFGVHNEDDSQNRFLRLEQTHPMLHSYVINNLKMGDLLDYMNIKYKSQDK